MTMKKLIVLSSILFLCLISLGDKAEKKIYNVTATVEDTTWTSNTLITDDHYSFSGKSPIEFPILNLEIGKSFTIETITHIDTSSQSPYRIWDEQKWKVTPLFFDLEKQVYHLKIEMTYYRHLKHEKNEVRGWQESEVYETGYLMSYRSPVVYLNSSKAPVFVEIQRNGVITSFDFSEYNLSKTPDGEPLKLAPFDQSDLEKYLQRLFFHNPSSDECSKNKIVEPGKYSILSEDEDYMTLNVIRDKDRLWRIEVVDEKIVLNKKTGLIVQKQKNYLVNKMTSDKTWVPSGIFNNAVLFQKNYSDISLEKIKSRYLDGYQWVDTILTSANTLIKCKITNRIAGEDSIDVFIDLNNSACFRIALSNNDEIELGLTLDKPTPIRIQYPIKQQNKNYQQLIRNNNKSIFIFDAEAGDCINLELCITDSSLNLVSAKGIFSTYFNYDKKFNLLLENDLSFLLTNSTFINEKILPLLNKYKYHADPRIYLDKLFEISYWVEILSIANHNREMSLISPQAGRDENKIYPIENVIINNSLAKENSGYLSFLNIYLNYILSDQIQNLTGVQTFNSKTTVENRYYLAEALLAEPVKSNYLAFYIRNTLLTEDPEVVKSIFESFRRNYKESSVYPKLEKVYNQFIALTPGNVAPNFTLKDIYGEEYSLSDFKKKVVVLQFFNYQWSMQGDEYDRTGRFIERIEFKNMNTANNLIYIYILNNKNQKLIELIKQKEYKGIFLVAENSTNPAISKVLIDYNFPSNGTEFLINKNGKIVKKTSTWRSEINMQEINIELTTPYKRTYDNLPGWIKTSILILVGLLIAIGLSFIFYRIINKRRLQKSELNKRMRELELTAIRAQMNPHFMYNCLNSIQNLVQKNKNEEAHLYLSKFASLIRNALNTSKKEEISLNEELETLQGYIDLEKLRFEFDFRLIVNEDIDTISLFVPPMLLQPIVENALLHGLLPKPENRILTIDIEPNTHNICISVEDNGIGRIASQSINKTGNGKGLELTNERLTLMSNKYKIQYQMNIEDLTDSDNHPLGTRVTISIEEE